MQQYVHNCYFLIEFNELERFMKSTTFAIFVTAIVFQGCTSHMSDDLEEQLAEKDNTYIYDIKLQNIIEPLDKKDQTFSRFPFISQSIPNDFKGHFSPEFYAKNKSELRTSSLDKVDIWSLELEPDLLDVIYTKAIWIEDYKDVSDDLFINICYTYNLSDGQQEILKEWIRKGGTFWIENGVYATGSEMGPEKRLPQKQSFLGHQVHTSYFALDNSMSKKKIVFDELQTSKPFSNIRSLQLDIDRAAQSFFIIDGQSQIKDALGQSMLNITSYGEGDIVSMLPFESYDAYRDGELLRWELLNTLENMKSETSPTESIAPTTVDGTPNTAVSASEVTPPQTTLTKGRSIQIFSYRSKTGAYEELKKASDYRLARVEKIGDYYVGRVGMYATDGDARTDLKALASLFPGAYMRTCVYEVPVATQATPEVERAAKYPLMTMDDTLDIETRPTKPKATETKSVLTKGRCIQIFTYRNKAGAYKEIAKVDDHGLARVEKNGSLYVGRVGMFASDREARKELEQIRAKFPDAYMRTCVYEVPERTVSSSQTPRIDTREVPAQESTYTASPEPVIATPPKPVEQAVVRTKGRCIQLFSYRNRDGAYEEIKKAEGYGKVRVEKPGSYYVGRVGMYASDYEAKEDLRRLQKDFPGAYMRTCVYYGGTEDSSSAPTPSKYTLKTMDDTIERHTEQEAPIAGSEAPAKAAVLTKGRCIQLFSYINIDGAYEALEDARPFRLARIEKYGRYYSGRVGMYATDDDAVDDLARLQQYYPGAYMRTCVYDPQR